jgi:hypothetical protein|tara:strand:- start:5933 stop:6247 length:315 start_codon:yes stop_codon:yes gene_type:complete
MSKRIIQNEVFCYECETNIFSRHRHDFVTCKCGNISVDGGMDYLRRVGGEKPYAEWSMSMDEDVLNECRNILTEETTRNDLGKVLAILRVLRDNNLLDMEEFNQ